MQDHILPFKTRRRTHQCDWSYFQNLDHQNKAYWIGTIWADGTVNQYKQSCKLTLEYRIPEVNWLEKLKKDLKADYPIKITRSGWSVGFSINSKEMFHDLAQYNILPNKTYLNNAPKNIPDNMVSHFVRGLFDGDGCIITSGSKRAITIVNCKSCCDWLAEQVYKHTGVTGRVRQHYGSKVAYDYCITNKKDSSSFARWIYSDSPQRFMPRKFQKFANANLI